MEHLLCSWLIKLFTFHLLLHNRACYPASVGCQRSSLEYRPLAFSPLLDTNPGVERLENRNETRCRMACVQSTACNGLILFKDTGLCLLLSVDAIHFGKAPPHGATTLVKVCQTNFRTPQDLVDEELSGNSEISGVTANNGKVRDFDTSAQTYSGAEIGLYVYGIAACLLGLIMFIAAVIIYVKMIRNQRMLKDSHSDHQTDDSAARSVGKSPDQTTQSRQTPGTSYDVYIPDFLLRRKHSDDPEKRRTRQEQKRVEKRRKSREEKARKKREKEERKRLAKSLKRKGSNISAATATSMASGATSATTLTSLGARSSVSSVVSRVPSLLKRAASAIGGSVQRARGNDGDESSSRAAAKAYVIERDGKVYVIQPDASGSLVDDATSLGRSKSALSVGTAVTSEATTAVGSVVAYADELQQDFGVEQRSFYRSTTDGNDRTLRQTQNTDLAFGAMGGIG